MKIATLKPDPSLCPLCGKPNNCLSAIEQQAGQPCWCSDPAIRFPQALLDRVPEEKKRKACICKACVLKFLDESRSQEAL